MVGIEKKIDLLCKIANLFNEEEITWAVGASLLLYFEGITDNFNDIDIMVLEKDVVKAKSILLSLGKLCQPNLKSQYTTKHFYEFIIDEVDIDLMAGFGIVYDEKVYDCSLKEEQIIKHKEINDALIPLQSVELWREYYRLMKRDKKVEMIDSKLIVQK